VSAGENFWIEAKLARERIALDTSACGLKLQEKSQFHSHSRLAKLLSKSVPKSTSGRIELYFVWGLQVFNRGLPETKNLGFRLQVGMANSWEMNSWQLRL